MKLSQNKLVHHLQVAITCKEHNTEFVMQRRFYNLKQSLHSKSSEFLLNTIIFYCACVTQYLEYSIH